MSQPQPRCWHCKSPRQTRSTLDGRAKKHVPPLKHSENDVTPNIGKHRCQSFDFRLTWNPHGTRATCARPRYTGQL